MIARPAAILTFVLAASSAFAQSHDSGPIKTREVPMDCKVITAAPGDLVTAPVWLQEPEFQDPHYYDGVYTGTPRQGGFSSHPFRERVQLQFVGPRTTLPWETETFEACLVNRSVHVRPLKAAFTYEIEQDPREKGNFFLVAGRKRAMAPDPEGIELALWWNADIACPSVTITDKWTAFYPGGKTEVEFEVWQNNNNLPDSYEGKYRLTTPTTAKAETSLCDSVRFWKSYYVKWRFKRDGGPSTSDWSKTARSNTVANAP